MRCRLQQQDYDLLVEDCKLLRRVLDESASKESEEELKRRQEEVGRRALGASQEAFSRRFQGSASRRVTCQLGLDAGPLLALGQAASVALRCRQQVTQGGRGAVAHGSRALEALRDVQLPGAAQLRGHLHISRCQGLLELERWEEAAEDAVLPCLRAYMDYMMYG